MKTLTDPSLYDGSMVGAWRKRFEEEAVKAVDAGEAAAATATAASNPKPAKPDAGRAIETEAADTPAKRAKEGEAPVSATERKDIGGRRKTATVHAGNAATRFRRRRATSPMWRRPRSRRRAANPRCPTTPIAGTPPSDARPAATAARASPTWSSTATRTS